MTLQELAAHVQRLKSSQFYSDSIDAIRRAGGESVVDLRQYANQKDHWIAWLSGYDGPGYYGRSNWDRDACYVYNHVNNTAMVIWIAEAAGVDDCLISTASRYTTCGQIRKLIPWSMVEKKLNEGVRRGCT